MDYHHVVFLLYCRPVDQISIPAKTEKPNKEEDDAHSTTSYDLYTITPRSFMLSLLVWQSH